MIALSVVGYWTYRERRDECDTSMRYPLLAEDRQEREALDPLEQGHGPVQLEMSNLSLG